MLSSKTHGRGKKISRDMPNALKLPFVQKAVQTKHALGSKSATGIPGNEDTSGVNLSCLTQSEAVSLLRQYNNIGAEDARHPTIALPSLKMSTRSGWAKQDPVRNRITSKSLDKVDRPPQYFTEGLSSISKCKELPLAIHRRDILGANMPENVRLAREGSKISIGVNYYRPRKKQTTGVRAHRNRALQIVCESGAETANQILAPLAGPGTVTMGDGWGDFSAKQDSRISKLLKTMEERYGRDVVVRALPSTPSVNSSDFLWESTAGSTPIRTPRKSPVQPAKPSLSIVSLGDSLAKLPEKRKPFLQVSKPRRDDHYNALERFRQHSYDKITHNSELKFNQRNNQDGVVRYPFIGKLRSYLERKLKTKPARKKLKIVVSLKDVTGSSDVNDVAETDEYDDDSEEKSDPHLRPDGTFHVEGVKGVGAGDRLWSPSSISTSASVANPPPSVEVSLYELEYPNLKDHTAMFAVPDNISDLTTNGFAALDGDASEGISICSSLLSVPSASFSAKRPPLKDGQEELQQGASNRKLSEKENATDARSENGCGHCPSISDGNGVAAETDVRMMKNREELAIVIPPEQSDADVAFALDRYAREDARSHGNTEEQQQETRRHHRKSQDRKLKVDQDMGYFSGPVDVTPNSSPVHSQSIVFISPMDVQPNAKRQ